MFEQQVTLGPGTGTFASHSFEILLMLLGAFLLGLWLGWVLWSRFRQIAEKLRLDNESLSTSLLTLTAELDALKIRFAAVDTERADLSASAAMLAEDKRSLMERLQFAQTDLHDTLTMNRQLETELALSGDEETIVSNDIAGDVASDIPFEVSSAADMAEELALDAAESRTAILPDTAAGATLSMDQGMHTSQITFEGQEPKGTVIVEEEDHFIHEEPQILDPTVFESTTRSALAPTDLDDDHFSDDAFHDFTRNSHAPVDESAAMESFQINPILHQDDLKIVEGIGPKIEQLLFNSGIHTYSELSAAPVSRLKEILIAAGSRYAMHDPGTWSAQSLLAANGEWENLKAYQEFLNAGKRPDK